MRAALVSLSLAFFIFFFQAEDGIRDDLVTGVQTCALPIYVDGGAAPSQTSAPGANAAGMSLRAAQQKLNALGYTAGTPDGSMGKNTQNALREFQRDQSLPQTGRLDRATSQALQQQ